MAKNYSELIKARLEQATGAIAQSVKGLIYFKSDTDRPVIDDGTDVSQIMMEKHLPEARRDTPVVLADTDAPVPIVIDGSNDTFTYIDNGLGAAFVSSIPQGTYADGTALAAAMQTALTGNTSGTVTVTYNVVSFLFTVNITANSSPRFVSGTFPAVAGYTTLPSGTDGFNDISITPTPFTGPVAAEVQGILPVASGGTNNPALNSQGLLFANQLADAVDTDTEMFWDNVAKKLQVGAGSATAQKITVYGGLAVQSGSTFLQSTQVAGGIFVSSTLVASVPFPAMTEAQRDLLPLVPPEGSGVYNLDTKRLNTYDSDAGEWIEVGSGAGGLSFWQKELSADLNADGVIGDLAVTGLTIGEKYKVTLNVRAVRQATALSEIQEITFSAVPTYGTWEIEFNGDTVDFLGYDITASELQQKFEDFAVGAGNCAVSGDFATGFVFSFGGALANQDVPEITIAASTLTSGETGGTNEVQDLVFSATPTGGSFTITFDGATTAAIPYNATTGQVQAALELLPNINGVTVTAI